MTGAKFIDFEKMAAIFLKYWDKYLIDGVGYTLALSAITVAGGVVFASLLALTVVAKGKIVHVLFVAWSGFAYGYFCVISISAFGAKGLLLCLVALFPQFLAYVPAYLGLVQLSERRREHVGWRKTAAVVFLFVILIVGILLESYINPLILQKLLKIF